MKIARIETYATHSIAVVKLYTDDGAEGIGQISTYNSDISATVLHRQVAPQVLGMDIDEQERMSTLVTERNHKFPWSYVCRALGGVDTALWDLKGKLAGKSVCELLGGTPRPFPVYGSSMNWHTQPEEEAEWIARNQAEFGYDAFKIRIGQPYGHNEDTMPGRIEAVVPAVRKAIGDDCRLLVDANSCFTPERAIEVGKTVLEPNGVCHFEEPCPYWELEWTQQVNEALDIDVTGGEQDADLAQWRRMIRMKAVNVVQPDLLYVGGLTRALAVAKFAQPFDLPCVPHSANRTMVTIFALHMMGAIENAGPYVEFALPTPDWCREFLDPVPEAVDGKVQIPDGPGWGVQINPDWFAKAELQISKAG